MDEILRFARVTKVLALYGYILVSWLLGTIVALLFEVSLFCVRRASHPCYRVVA